MAVDEEVPAEAIADVGSDILYGSPVAVVLGVYGPQKAPLATAVMEEEQELARDLEV